MMKKSKIFGMNKVIGNNKTMSLQDLVTFRDNLRNLSQLVAITVNNADLSIITGLKDQMTNSVKFLDDLAFIFGKMIDQIEK
jgi:hypothetical protein